MFGYSKSEVEDYIKSLKAEYESRLQAEHSDANRVANELTILKKKLERYEVDYVQKQEKVANALITAEDQANKIIVTNFNISTNKNSIFITIITKNIN